MSRLLSKGSVSQRPWRSLKVNILIITDLGEEAFYSDNQARFSYRFEISTIILLMQKAYNINKLNKKLRNVKQNRTHKWP